MGTPEAACSDADALNMQGIWELITSYAPEAPPDLVPTSSVFKVKLASSGSGPHGGMLFEGVYVTPETQVGSFKGETFYHQRGVQVMQMVMEYTPEPYCYYQLFCGRHIRDSEVVEGAWVDVGGHGSGPYGRGPIEGYFGRFLLTKTTE